MKITAIVVGFNDCNLLEKCLTNLYWCSEILYFDLGSSDDSISIARKYLNTKIIKIKKLPHVELIHEKYCNDIETDLLVITDPDEIINPSLLKEISAATKHFDLRVHSELRVNMNYFFKGKKLKGTYWGGIYSSRFIYNKRFIKFTGLVHDGITLEVNNPFEYKWKDTSIIEHHWAKNWKHLFEKHKRYLASEGESMYSRGIRFSNKSQILETFNAFWFSYRMKKGYEDGLTGFLLSLFWSWYTFNRWTSLKKYQKIE